ncbi:MAG: alpha/beta fold hydrolase [Pseudomonadota bacterium]
MPPLLERELFFGSQTITHSKLSPNGRWISFIKPHQNVMNIWVKGIDEPMDKAHPVTADTRRNVKSYLWSEDSRYILYVQDKGGDNNFHLYAIDPAGKIDEETGVPKARNITPVSNINPFVLATPESNPNEILVGLNARNRTRHDIYRFRLETGQNRPVARGDQDITDWLTDLDGDVRLAVYQRKKGGSETRMIEDGQPGRVLFGCDFGETCEPVRIHKDGRRVYVISNVDTDLAQLILVDMKTGEQEVIDSDPEQQVDIVGVMFSDLTEELSGTIYFGDRQRLYLHDETFKQRLDWVRGQLPDGELDISSLTEDESKWLITVQQDINPGSVYLYDAVNQKVEKLYDTQPDLPSEHLAPMKSVHYMARDGIKIRGYLVTPEGVEARNLPTIIYPHGGPWERDIWGYHPFAQFFANRGYAVLLPNYRGSTGYGKAFLNAGDNQWGTGIMQNDISDAAAYLIKSGVADPNQIAIAGGSYGGYAALAGLAFTPGLYAAGISIAGPSNIATLINSIPAYWTAGVHELHMRVGDPDNAEDAIRLASQSPLFHAKNISAPLLFIQGAKDTRAKKEETDQIVVTMRDLDIPVEYVLATNEKHGFQGWPNQLAMYAAIESFLAKHLEGRSQTAMSRRLTQHLKTLQVDIDRLIRPELLNSVTVAIPDNSASLASERKYTSRIQIGDRTINLEVFMDITREEHADKPVWRVEARTRADKNTSQDIALLAIDDLKIVHRKFTQGPLKGTIDYSPDEINGTIRRLGRDDVPLHMKLDEPVFGNDAAMQVLLENLPFAADYRASGNTYDLNTHLIQRWLFEFEGEEVIKVPAGTFETLAIKFSNTDGSSGKMWITQDKPRYAVKTEMNLPATMGSGISTTVLKEFKAIEK